MYVCTRTSMILAKRVSLSLSTALKVYSLSSMVASIRSELAAGGETDKVKKYRHTTAK